MIQQPRPPETREAFFELPLWKPGDRYAIVSWEKDMPLITAFLGDDGFVWEAIFTKDGWKRRHL